MARPTVNERFFSKWASELAYILGFITTDGCLVEHTNGHHGLDITSKDRGLLEVIKREMQAEHKIGKKPRGYRLQIRNRAIYDGLLRLGLTPRKSKTIKFPKIPKKYLFDFIRGCFDGDGCVKVWQEKRWRRPWQLSSFFCSASLVFLKKLQKKLQSMGNLSRGWIWHHRSTELTQIFQRNIQCLLPASMTHDS